MSKNFGNRLHCRVDITLGKQVEDAGLDMEAELVFPPCHQDRVRGNTNCNPNPNHKYYHLSQPYDKRIRASYGPTCSVIFASCPPFHAAQGSFNRIYIMATLRTP